MPRESINEQGFNLQPGGAMEEANPTTLGPNQYTQASGIDKAGTSQRMPGKTLINSYADAVLQIAAFGGAVLIQHGSTLLMYPDACAVASPPSPPSLLGSFLIDVQTAAGIDLYGGAYISQVLFQTLNEDSSRTTLITFEPADIWQPGVTTPTGPSDYINYVDITPYLLNYSEFPATNYCISVNIDGEFTSPALIWSLSDTPSGAFQLNGSVGTGAPGVDVGTNWNYTTQPTANIVSFYVPASA